LLVLALVQEGQRLLFEAQKKNYQETIDSDEAAVRRFEDALQAGCRDTNVSYLLALAFHRQGKTREAHDALRHLPGTVAEVEFLRGVLSFREKQFACAEQHFAAAWEQMPRSYEVCYNLLLTRLSQEKIDAAVTLFPDMIRLAPATADQHAWTLLQALLQSTRNGNGAAQPDLRLEKIDPQEEQQLLHLVTGLGHAPTTYGLLQFLTKTSPGNGAFSKALYDCALLMARKRVSECDWHGAARVLLPLAYEKEVSPGKRAALLNILGCCACLTQEFEDGAEWFATALRLAPGDICLEQNLALAHEWHGQIAQAEVYWDRYFQQIEAWAHHSAEPADYPKLLAYTGLTRLADSYAEQQSWASAITYAQRALACRPDDFACREKLFHLYIKAGRSAAARKTLEQIQQLQPEEPRFAFYELELIEGRNLEEIGRFIAGIDRLQKRFPEDASALERTQALASGILPRLDRLSTQMSQQLTKVRNQVRRLPSYQIDWSAVHDLVRDLRGDLQTLRSVANKCLPLLGNEQKQQAIHDLCERIDHALEQCRALGG
jgi:Flp pilus assembly protein TadD